jgi:hypothetical protein
MKGIYVKPAMLYAREPVGFIPAVLGAGMALGSALGLAASSSAALGGLAMGAAAGLGAGAAGAALASGMAKKKGRSYFDSWECLPSLDAVGVYT